MTEIYEHLIFYKVVSDAFGVKRESLTVTSLQINVCV